MQSLFLFAGNIVSNKYFLLFSYSIFATGLVASTVLFNKFTAIPTISLVVNIIYGAIIFYSPYDLIKKLEETKNAMSVEIVSLKEINRNSRKQISDLETIKAGFSYSLKNLTNILAESSKEKEKILLLLTEASADMNAGKDNCLKIIMGTENIAKKNLELSKNLKDIMLKLELYEKAERREHFMGKIENLVRWIDTLGDAGLRERILNGTLDNNEKRKLSKFLVEIDFELNRYDVSL